MKEKIQKICEEICKRDVTDEQLVITGKILDSFQLMELICSLEEEFQVQFLPEEIMELDHFECIDHMTDLVRDKTAEKTA